MSCVSINKIFDQSIERSIKATTNYSFYNLVHKAFFSLYISESVKISPGNKIVNIVHVLTANGKL